MPGCSDVPARLAAAMALLKAGESSPCAPAVAPYASTLNAGDAIRGAAKPGGAAVLTPPHKQVTNATIMITIAMPRHRLGIRIVLMPPFFGAVRR
jgi:hypothetical protein